MEIVEISKAEFWLHRMIDEYCAIQKRNAERLSILNHQAQNFKKMCPSSQNLVIRDLNEDMRSLKWSYRVMDNDEMEKVRRQ